MSRTDYVRIAESAVPAGLRFDVPRHNQGQIIEVAYADFPRAASEACAGSKYKRITDKSDRSVEYYMRSYK